MEINFNLKVKSGKRSPIEVRCYATSVNEKRLEFQGSNKTITETKISNWLEKALKEVLEKYKNEP
jgi:hypothetical protein